MGLDFGMEFDEQGNPIPGTGGRDGADLSDFRGRRGTVVRAMRHLKAHRKLGRTSEHRTFDAPESRDLARLTQETNES
jgi:hypothetical protein